ncbi:MAG: FliH/SctL family protein [Chloroflexota bacterium]
MSSATFGVPAGRGFLRAPRRGGEIHLGVDGRVQTEEEARRAAMALPEVTTEAATIIEAAQERADAILRDAAMTAATVQQDAYAEGFAAGQRDGTVIARAELLEAIALVQHVASEAKAMRDQLVVQAEREIVELAIEATEAVIGSRTASDEALVYETVRRALERAGSQNIVRVRVSPDERERVAVRLAETQGAVAPFEVLADGTVHVGGCIVDTEAGRVDARLDVQLGELATLLRDALPARPDSAAPGDWSGDAR